MRNERPGDVAELYGIVRALEADNKRIERSHRWLRDEHHESRGRIVELEQGIEKVRSDIGAGFEFVNQRITDVQQMSESNQMQINRLSQQTDRITTTMDNIDQRVMEQTATMQGIDERTMQHSDVMASLVARIEKMNSDNQILIRNEVDTWGTLRLGPVRDASALISGQPTEHTPRPSMATPRRTTATSPPGSTSITCSPDKLPWDDYIAFKGDGGMLPESQSFIGSFIQERGLRAEEEVGMHMDMDDSPATDSGNSANNTSAILAEHRVTAEPSTSAGHSGSVEPSLVGAEDVEMRDIRATGSGNSANETSGMLAEPRVSAVPPLVVVESLEVARPSSADSLVTSAIETPMVVEPLIVPSVAVESVVAVEYPTTSAEPSVIPEEHLALPTNPLAMSTEFSMPLAQPVAIQAEQSSSTGGQILPPIVSLGEGEKTPERPSSITNAVQMSEVPMALPAETDMRSSGPSQPNISPETNHVTNSSSPPHPKSMSDPNAFPPKCQTANSQPIQDMAVATTSHAPSPIQRLGVPMQGLPEIQTHQAGLQQVHTMPRTRSQSRSRTSPPHTRSRSNSGKPRSKRG